MTIHLMKEPPVEPPEPDSVVADCGCEVYAYEYIYEWDGRTLCPDCMETELNKLPLHELVTLLGGSAVVVADYE